MCVLFGGAGTDSKQKLTICSPLKRIHRKLKMLLKLQVSNFQFWKRRLPPRKRATGLSGNSREGTGAARQNFLPASFSLPLLGTSLTRRWPQVWPFRRLLRRCGDWSEAHGALLCSRKLRPQSLFWQVPCPQQASEETPTANQTKLKSLDSMFVFFWRTTTSTFDFREKMFVLENANKYVWLAFKWFKRLRWYLHTGWKFQKSQGLYTMPEHPAHWSRGSPWRKNSASPLIKWPTQFHNGLEQ